MIILLATLSGAIIALTASNFNRILQIIEDAIDGTSERSGARNAEYNTHELMK